MSRIHKRHSLPGLYLCTHAIIIDNIVFIKQQQLYTSKKDIAAVDKYSTFIGIFLSYNEVIHIHVLYGNLNYYREEFSHCHFQIGGYRMNNS